MSKTKPVEEWEKEFDKKFCVPCGHTKGGMALLNKPQQVKSFISGLLAKEYELGALNQVLLDAKEIKAERKKVVREVLEVTQDLIKRSDTELVGLEDLREILLEALKNEL